MSGRPLARAALGAVLLACAGLASAAPAAAPKAAPKPAARKSPPIHRFTLPNGLRVVLQPDRSVPIVSVAMIVDVGGRHEAPGRSGFSHLFEHLMFEGSANAPKGTFDRVLESYGGSNNASAHQDFTMYYEVLPSNALPIALWLDADRLSALSITEENFRNQVKVVMEEKRLRVDNEPYGPLHYIEISSRVFHNWANAHPTIGSFEDLGAATLEDVKEFFNAYYAPSNIRLAITGDLDPAKTRAMVEKYFAWIPNRGKPKAVDVSEPPQREARRFAIEDAHANLPALAIVWTGMPPRRWQPDFYAMGLLGRLLFHGNASRLYQGLVKEAQTAISVSGGLGFPIADLYEYKQPGLFGGFIVHKPGVSPDGIRQRVLDELRRIASEGVPQEELERVKTKYRSEWIIEGQSTLGRAKRLLVASLLDGDPAAAEAELARFMDVTPDDIRRAAAKYLPNSTSNTFVVAAKPAPEPPRPAPAPADAPPPSAQPALQFPSWSPKPQPKYGPTPELQPPSGNAGFWDPKDDPMAEPKKDVKRKR